MVTFCLGATAKGMKWYILRTQNTENNANFFKQNRKYRIEREKFDPRPGLEPGPLASHANALPLSYPEQVWVHDKINLLELSFLTSFNPYSANR